MSNSTIRNKFLAKDSGRDNYIEYLRGNWSFKGFNVNVLIAAVGSAIVAGIMVLYEAQSF
jgi:hypothetical protein